MTTRAYRFCAKTFAKLSIVSLALVGTTGCDPEHHKKCEWTLEPDPSRTEKVDDGFVPACARNRSINKQDCRLQTTLDFARKVEGKKFRYVDMETKTKGIPRTIKAIDFCN